MPGVLVMTAFFGAGWGGMPVIDDLNRGVIDRFLTTPVHRVALVAGRIVQGAIGVLVQSMIIIVLALIVGAHFRNGVGGVALMIFLAVLLAAATTAWSYGVALYVRKEETLIALMQFLLLPLTFLSGAFMQLSLVPGWIQPHRGLQPAQLGGGGRALSRAQAHGLGLCGLAHRLSLGAAGGRGAVCYAGVSVVSAQYLVLSSQLLRVGFRGR